MLSDREQRSLLQIERKLRAEDDRFTSSFDAFRVDLTMVFPDEPKRPVVSSLIWIGRWTLAILALALIPSLWMTAVMSTGDLAGLTRILVFPLSALLLAAGLALHPDRRRRSGARSGLPRSARGGDRGQSTQSPAGSMVLR